MSTIECHKCSEPEEMNCRTGASIDGKYHCQACYDEVLGNIESNIIKEGI